MFLFLKDIFRCTFTLLGYSSESAGGSVIGDTVENTELEMPSPADEPRETLKPAEVVEPPPAAPPAPAMGLSADRMAEIEEEFKARMEAHADALRKAMEADLVQKKRQAEDELENELCLKRQKV